MKELNESSKDQAQSGKGGEGSDVITLAPKEFERCRAAWVSLDQAVAFPDFWEGWQARALFDAELEKRLTVAEQRAAKFEGLLLKTNELLYQIQGDPGAVPSSSIDAMRGEVFTALKPAAQHQGEPVACLTRSRNILTQASIAVDGKDHFSAWSEWAPNSIEYGRAVTDPIRNNPVCYEIELLFKEQTAPVAVADHKAELADKLESLAETIYNSWASKPGFMVWVPGGNSHMQDEARQIASRTFELALSGHAAEASKE